MLTLKLQFFTLYQQVFIEYIVNHPFFQKFQLKCSLTNILQDFKESIFFQLSFFEDLFKQIFLASNHMLFSIFNSYKFYLFLSNCFFIASFAISIDFIAFSQLLCNPTRKSSNFGNFICIVRFLFYKYLSKCYKLYLACISTTSRPIFTN